MRRSVECRREKATARAIGVTFIVRKCPHLRRRNAFNIQEWLAAKERRERRESSSYFFVFLAFLRGKSPSL